MYLRLELFLILIYLLNYHLNFIICIMSVLYLFVIVIKEYTYSVILEEK